MSVFHGKQGKGAMREHRATKRREAVERDARAPRWSLVASLMGRKARDGELNSDRYLTRHDARGEIYVSRKPVA